MRSAEQGILERVNMALSLTFMSSALIVSAATMITIIAYTAAGHHLSPVQVRRSTGRRRGVVVSGVRRTNEVNARRARLAPGRVTVFGRVYRLGM